MLRTFCNAVSTRAHGRSHLHGAEEPSGSFGVNRASAETPQLQLVDRTSTMSLLEDLRHLLKVFLFLPLANVLRYAEATLRLTDPSPAIAVPKPTSTHTYATLCASVTASSDTPWQCLFLDRTFRVCLHCAILHVAASDQAQRRKPRLLIPQSVVTAVQVSFAGHICGRAVQR